MAADKTDYEALTVRAAKRILLELSNIISEYRDHYIVIGGWVPFLLCPDAQNDHVGSTDVDIALNHRTLTEAGYRTILEILTAHGYNPRGDQPFIFEKEVRIDGQKVMVEVDFLAGEYQGTTARHRTQKVLDMQPRKARGCDLAFINPIKVDIEGELPNGSLDKTSVRVASIVPFLMMKAQALSRLKEKDAYDIYFCLRHFPGGLDAVIEAFAPFRENNLVQEGLHILADKFASVDHVGPVMVADFEDVRETDARAMLLQDVFQRVRYILEKVGII